VPLVQAATPKRAETQADADAQRGRCGESLRPART
jgi:hypothetical protein